MQLRVAQIVPASFNEADNSVDCVWTTGARRRAYDWFNDVAYEEELDVSPGAVDMSRFAAGTVQVLDSHDMYSGVRAILGIATRGDISAGQGSATLALSRDPAKAGTVLDIKGGIIRAMSFGYSVQRYEITRAQDRTDGVNLPLYRATRWTPQELSFVPVGADANAGTRNGEASHTRSQPLHGVPCEFIRAAAQPSPLSPKEINMSDAELQAQREQEAAARLAETTRAADDAKKLKDAAIAEARALEVTRSAAITELCTRHNVAALAAGLIRAGSTLEVAGLAVLEERARQDAAAGGHRNTQVEKIGDEQDTHLRGIEEAFMHRVDTKTKLTDNGKKFRGMTLLEVGREYLESVGQNTRGMDKLQLATRVLSYRSNGMLTTSDFSNVLANIATKRLRMGYEENPGTYTRWARGAPNAPDFKQMSVVQLSAMPDLLQVNEHGEFKYGALTDGAEKYALLTYGRIISMSRQSLINDDLRAFDRLITGFGASAARLENRTVYAQLTANANMADGNALFAAAHANNATGAGSALQFSSLSAMRTAMRVQKGLQNEELNIMPAGIIVPAALEQVAYQLTSSNYTPNVQAQVNEFRTGGRTALDPIVEPILDGTANGATQWYGFASNSQIDTVEYCWLDGAAGPVIESELGFEVDGISFKCREDFAAKALDWRGLYRAVGV